MDMIHRKLFVVCINEKNFHQEKVTNVKTTRFVKTRRTETWNVRRRKCSWPMTRTLVHTVSASRHLLILDFPNEISLGNDMTTFQENGEPGCGMLWNTLGPVKQPGPVFILLSINYLANPADLLEIS